MAERRQSIRRRSIVQPLATLTKIQTLCGQLSSLKPGWERLYYDAVRLIDRCLLFKPIVDDIVLNNLGRISLDLVETFEGLLQLLEDVAIFVEQYKHSVSV